MNEKFNSTNAVHSDCNTEVCHSFGTVVKTPCLFLPTREKRTPGRSGVSDIVSVVVVLRVPRGVEDVDGPALVDLLRKRVGQWPVVPLSGVTA